MRVLKVLGVVIVLIILFNFSFIKSVSIMYFYSKYNEIKSIPTEKGFKINIPGGLITSQKDWYPFVITFNDENAAKSLNKDINLTILYNFGAFKKGRSMFYDENSPYYSAFYGAYIVESIDKEEIFGFNKGKIDEEQIKKLVKHDLGKLVLQGIGCKNPNIELNSIGTKKVDYIDYKDWFRIDGQVISNSPLHVYSKNYISYIQYGKPPEDYKGKDYKQISLNGRIYCRYFDEYDVTIILYAIAQDVNTIEFIDNNFLQNTVIAK